jgi:cell division GTPase FtsZ
MTDLTAVEVLGDRREALRAELAKVTAQLAQLAVQAHEAGAAETVVAKAAKVDRMTMRKWLGKR